MSQHETALSQPIGTKSVPDCAAEVAKALLAPLGEDTLTITDFKKMSGGAIQENWLLTAHSGSAAPRKLVLRTDSPSSVQASMSRKEEYSVLSAAYKAGVKVPEPVYLCTDNSVLGRDFFVMEALTGTAGGRELTSGQVAEPDRQSLCFELGASLANLHTITPPEPALDFMEPPKENHAQSCIDDYRAYLDSLESKFLPLEWGLRWCEINRPSPLPPVLIHRDFRTGNYMVDQGKLRGILDWEFASWGDPREDIGWFTARCWRFARPDLEAGGIGELEDFLKGYSTTSKLTITEKDLRYWQVMAHLRWAIIAIQQAERYLTHGENKLELALTGRMLPELEQEILLLTGADQ